jgi:sulfatase maturation enzyme AslB (radical SAM superfamily)
MPSRSRAFFELSGYRLARRNASNKRGAHIATAKRTLDLVSLGSKHVRNAISEELYLRTGRDVTRPASIFAEVVERCNYKCRYCDYWRRPNYREEMTIDEWWRALSSLKEFIGAYYAEFAGGESYIKKCFLDLLRVLPRQRHSLGRHHQRRPLSEQDDRYADS